VAFVVTRIVILWKPGLYDWWRQLVPFGYTGTSLLAFALAALTWMPLNRSVSDRDTEQGKAVEQWGDYLERLLNRSLKETKQVSLTLRTGKVYIGFVTSNFDPAYERRYIQLLPVLSGYRDDETKDLVITRDYARAYQRMIDEDSAYLLTIADEFQLVIPTAEIVSANHFDPDVFAIFQDLDGADSGDATMAVAGGASGTGDSKVLA